MIQNPEHESTLEATEQNRREIIEKINQKIITMETIIDIDKKIIREHIRRAKEKYDIDYQPNRSDYDEFKKWLEALKNAKGILEGIELDSDTIIEQGDYIDKAQKLLDIIGKSLPDRQDRLIKSNADQFEQAITRKQESEIKLAELKKRLEELQLKREGNEKESLIVQNKFSGFMGRLSSLWKSNHDLPYNKEETEKEISDLEDQIKQVEAELEQSRFKNNSAGEEFEQQRGKEVEKPQVGIQQDHETHKQQGEEPYGDGNR